MKQLILILSITILSVACHSGKPKEPTKEKCDTCPSLSNEGKIDKPFKNKKKKK